MQFSDMQKAEEMIYRKSGKHVNLNVLWGALMHETGGLSSELSQYHNYGGMKTTVDTGLSVPENEYEGEGGANYYKNYESDEAFLEDWTNTVAAYIRDSKYDEINTPEEYVDALTWDTVKYFTDDPQNYIDGIYRFMGDIGSIARSGRGTWGAHGLAVQDNQNKPHDFWTDFVNSFKDSALDNGAVSVARTMWANMAGAFAANGSPFDTSYVATDEDIKAVQDALKGDTAAQQYVLSSNTSKESLMRKLAMKIEDKQRREELEGGDVTAQILGNLAGAVADPSLLLSFIPGLNGALGTAKVMQTLNKINKFRSMMAAGGKIIQSNKVLRYGEKVWNSRPANYGKHMAEAATIVGTDRYLANKYGGFEPDYATSMTLGAFVGAAGLRVSEHLKNAQNKAAEKIKNSIEGIEENTAAVSVGAPPPADAIASGRKVLAEEMKKSAERDIDFDIYEFIEGDVPERSKAISTTNAPDKPAEFGKMTEPDINEWNVFEEDALRAKNKEEWEKQKAAWEKAQEAKKRRLAEKEAEEAERNKPSNQRDVDYDVYENIEGDVPERLEEGKKADVDGDTRLNPEDKKLLDALNNEYVPSVASLHAKAMNVVRMATEWGARLMESGQLYVLPFDKAREAAKLYGHKLAANAKAFTIPKLGVSILIAEHVSPRNAESLIMHEIGVHLALKSMMSKADYDDLMEVVAAKLKNDQSAAWRRAAKQATSPEEGLAYWIEDRYKNADDLPNLIMQALRKGVVSDDTRIDKAVRDAFKAYVENAPTTELHAMIKRNLRNFLESGEVAKKLDDGSYIVGDIKYSKDNPITTVFDDVSDSGAHSRNRQSQIWGGKYFGLAYKWFENGRVFGNIYGILANSHSPLMQEIGRRLFRDARMMAKNDTYISADALKEHFLKRWERMYQDYVDARTQYIHDQFGYSAKLNMNDYIYAIDGQAILCHDAQAGLNVGLGKTAKDFPPEIQKMADIIRKMREDMVYVGKKDARQLGGREGYGSLIEKDWEPLQDGLYRVIDSEKLGMFLSRFNKIDEAYDFLTKYARSALDEDAVQRWHRAEFKKQYEAALEEWSKKKQKLEEYVKNKKNPDKKTKKEIELEKEVNKKPELYEPTEEEWQKIYDKESRDWAYGVTDRNASRLTFNEAGTGTYVDAFKRRTPIDTTAKMLMKDGTEFSFNTDLRNMRLDDIIPQQLNMFSGELAINATLGDPVALKQSLDALAQELKKNDLVVNPNHELEALNLGLDRILGRGTHNQFGQKLGDAFSNMARTYTYANVGGNMTFNQLAEFGGAVAYVGMKALTDMIPGIGKILRDVRLGSEKAAVIDKVERMLAADDLATRMWDMSSSTDSRVFRDAMNKVSEQTPVPTTLSKGLDLTNRIIKRAALLTSTVNFMPKLTNAMIRSVKRSVIEDCMDWAAGASKRSWRRNPFSKEKFAAIGLNDPENIEAFRQTCKKYLIDGKGDGDKWWKEDPDSFFLWKQLVDNQTHRAIQQQTVGNMNPFKEKHRLFFQFKDFTLQAINGQFMRALTSHERDDIMATLYSMATNASTYYALTVARGYMYYPNDERKRTEYIERNASLERLLLAGFTRMSMMAPLSFGSDAFEVATGTPLFRTTVDNTNRKNTKSLFDMHADDWIGTLAGNAARQFPVVGSTFQAGSGVMATGRMLTGNGDKKDIDEAIRGLPLGRWLAMTGLASVVKDKSSLPDYDVKVGDDEKTAQKRKLHNLSQVAPKKKLRNLGDIARTKQTSNNSDSSLLSKLTGGN